MPSVSALEKGLTAPVIILLLGKKHSGFKPVFQNSNTQLVEGEENATMK